MRAIWWTYAVLCTAFTVAAIFVPNIAPGVNGFQVSIGLLLVSVGAATALAEERAQGGLDVVLATPMASRSIVLGKWWGAYRVVPRLAILPGLLMLGRGFYTLSWGEALAIAGLVVGLVLAYGAVIVGLGLLVAIAQPRPGRAAAIGVASYLGLTVAYPAAALPLFRNMSGSLLPLWPSPFFGPYVPSCIACWGRNGPWRNFWIIHGYLFLAAVALVGLILRWAALRLFDRGLGRVREQGEQSPIPRDKPKLAFDPGWSDDPAAIGPPA
jgi:ABC-type transport system involved in multi-copper enzyme maturation permease subunit